MDALIGDSLVENDKIGAANFMWSLPSQFVNLLSRKICEQENKLQDLTEKVQSYNE